MHPSPGGEVGKLLGMVITSEIWWPSAWCVQISKTSVAPVCFRHFCRFAYDDAQHIVWPTIKETQVGTLR